MKPELNTVLSRLLASLIVPGFVAAAPYLIWYGTKDPNGHAWLLSGTLAPSAVVVLIVFSAGLLMEEIGSWLEWHFWVKSRWDDCQDFEKRERDWYLYLMVKDVPETMADHISHLVSRLKWELSGGPGFIAGCIPTAIEIFNTASIGCKNFNLSVPWLFLLGLQIATGGFLIYKGSQTMRYLIKIRSKLLEQIHREELPPVC
jgi:hypothetical protein